MTRLYHFSDRQFVAGDVLLPAAQIGHHDAWHQCWPHYDPNLVYVMEEGFLGEPYDLPYMSNFKHMYEVQPLGEVIADPEGAGLLADWETAHGHRWTGPWLFDATCAICQHEDATGGYEGPEWYHPYNKAVPSARVIREVDPVEAYECYEAETKGARQSPAVDVSPSA